MTENIPEWITNLALDIYNIIQQYKAMPRFHEMVNKWAENRKAEIDKLRTRNEQRRLHFEQKVAYEPRLKDYEAGPPEQGWQFEDYLQNTDKKTEPVSQRSYKIIRGWVPLKLSNSMKPEITQLFPLSREHKLTLIEKYTVLAAVCDYAQKGTEEVSPWQWPDFNLDQSEEALSDAKKSLFFEGLCDQVSKLNPNEEGWLKAILNDIKKDVSKEEKPAETEQETKREQEGMVVVRKPWYKRTWIIIVGFVTVLTGLAALVCICESETGKRFIESFKRKPSISVNYERTPLYVRTKKRVDDFYESIRNEKLDPWLFINAGVKVQVTKYNGDVVNYRGIKSFTGSPRIVFWGDDFIPPFIEDAIIKVFDQTIDECRKNGLDPEIYVYEAKRILGDFIYKIYNRMADMDQKLMKQAYSENFGHRDVSREIEKMCKRLDEYYSAAILQASGN